MEISLQDALQRWSGSVVVVNGSAMYVREISEEARGKFLLSGLRTLGNKWDNVKERVSFSDVEERLPELGNIQIGEAAYHIVRKPSRQYARGLVPGQLTAHLVGQYRITKADELSILTQYGGGIQPSIISPDVINAIYVSPGYSGFLAAVRDVSTGKSFSKAVTKDLAIAAGYSRWPVLFYDTRAVGLVKGDEIVLEKSAGCLRELVQRASPLHVSVKV